MYPKVITILLNIVFFGIADAQNISVNRPTKSLHGQLNNCVQTNQKLNTENSNLNSQIRKLSHDLMVSKDSIFYQQSKLIRLQNDNKTLIERNDFLSKNNISTENFISENKLKLQIANYEIETLSNPLVIKVYDLDKEALQQALIARLSEMNLGYFFEENENQFKITKTLEGNNDFGWLIDKSVIMLLEIKMRLESHRFNKNKTLVYVFTNFYEKPRFSNKQFKMQDDEDKAFFFQTKFIKLLETTIEQHEIKKNLELPK